MKQRKWFLVVGPVPSKGFLTARIEEKCEVYSKKQASGYVLFKVLKRRFPDAPIYPDEYTIIPMTETGQLEFEFK
jgi:hypothetical protein